MKPAFFAAMMKAPPCLPMSKAGAQYVADEKRDDAGLRKARRAVKHALRAPLAGYYVVKGSDARVAAATGRVPSHAKSPEVYIAQKAPLRVEGKRKHRSARAYARRQAKRHPGGAS